MLLSSGPVVIGFCGLPGSGKSEAARHLRDKHGFTWFNIGDFMKSMLSSFYACAGLSQEEIGRRLYGDLKRVPDPYLCGKTPTYALQTIGYEWRNLFSPSLFAQRWGDRARTEQRLVCDGMRYPDEMDVFRGLGGMLIRIERPGLKEETGHPAENQPLEPDGVIVNDGSIEDLHRRVDEFLNFVS